MILQIFINADYIATKVPQILAEAQPPIKTL